MFAQLTDCCHTCLSISYSRQLHMVASHVTSLLSLSRSGGRRPEGIFHGQTPMHRKAIYLRVNSVSATGFLVFLSSFNFVLSPVFKNIL